MPPRPLSPGPDDEASKAPSQFELAYARLQNILGFQKQDAFSKIVDISQSSVSDAKNRGVIPGEWAIKLFRSHRINPNYIYDGLPPVYIGQGGPDAQACRADPAHFLQQVPMENVRWTCLSDASMDPLIAKGSHVAYDTGRRSIVPGKAYCLELPLEGLTVRLLDLKKDEDLVRLLAVARDVPPQSVPLQRARDMVRGQAVWIMRPFG